MPSAWKSLLVALWCFASLSVHAQEDRSNARSPLGLNLAGVVDYSSEMPFVDVFKHARPWISQQQGKPWGQGPALDLTPEGWVRSLKPGQFATTLMCVAGGHPAGRYVCLYEGEGELEFQNNARVVKQTPGRMELEVSAKESMFLNLRRTNADNPVRNIRVIMPGFEQTYEKDPFYPPFLERCRAFRVIRFMDWQKTNDSKQRNWSERPTPKDFSQAGKGVALEYMIDLCNRLQIDPWFCMPHLASDDYVREFARMTQTRLDRKRRVFLEHSNEVWNGQFGQARYALEQGRKEKLARNDYQAQLFYHSRRSVEIFKIWEEVFEGKDRLVRVLGSQSANPWVSEQVMTYRDAYRQADAVATAPYFGGSLGDPKTAQEVAALSLDELFARCRKHIADNQKLTASVVKKAKALGLDVYAYEGGQHLVGHGGAENNDALTKLFHAANRDARMRELYLADLQAWKDAGGQYFAVFSSVARPSKWGSWGMLEFEGQEIEQAPKYRAIRDFLTKTPRWWDE